MMGGEHGQSQLYGHSQTLPFDQLSSGPNLPWADKESKSYWDSLLAAVIPPHVISNLVCLANEPVVQSV